MLKRTSIGTFFTGLTFSQAVFSGKGAAFGRPFFCGRHTGHRVQYRIHEMAWEAPAAGSCLCGKVAFVLSEMSNGVGLCHCGMCRKANGGTALAAVRGRVEFKADCPELAWYRSSPWGERGFCRACGSTLFWRAAGSKLWNVSAGALSDHDQDALEITEHIYIDDKPSFYDFADERPRSTGADFTVRVISGMQKQLGGDFAAQAIAQLRQMHGDEFADQVAAGIARPEN